MKLSRPLRFIAIIVVAITIASALNVAVTKKSFSENYPAVSLSSNTFGISFTNLLIVKENSFPKVAKPKHQD